MAVGTVPVDERLPFTNQGCVLVAPEAREEELEVVGGRGKVPGAQAMPPSQGFTFPPTVVVGPIRY